MPYIAPHGKSVVMHLQEAQRGHPFVTWTREDQSRAAKQLDDALQRYAPDVVAPIVSPGEEFGGITVIMGDHGCLTVRSNYNINAVQGVSRAYIDFETAAALRALVRRTSKGLALPRKRTRRRKG